MSEVCFSSLFGRPELSQVIRTHLLDTAKIGAFHAVAAWSDPVRSLDTLKAPHAPTDGPPVQSIRVRMLCWLYPNRGWAPLPARPPHGGKEESGCSEPDRKSTRLNSSHANN